MARKSIGKSKRFEVFKRDGFTCIYCGSKPPATVLEVDHVIAVKNGGDNDDHNLVTSCMDCNRGKAARPLDVVPESLASRAAIVAEREEQVAAYYEIIQAARDRHEDECWRVAEIYMKAFDDTAINRGYFASIGKFIKRLDLYRTMEAMELAVDQGLTRRRTFLYFCGVCWNQVRAAEGEN